MDDMTTRDKIDEIKKWLHYVSDELSNEVISYGEIAQVDQVYDSVRVFLEEE